MTMMNGACGGCMLPGLSDDERRVNELCPVQSLYQEPIEGSPQLVGSPLYVKVVLICEVSCIIATSLSSKS
jgi:hypothetical protein